MKLYALLDAFVEWLGASRAPSTRDYALSVTRSVKRHIKDREAESLRPTDVEKWIRKLGVNPTTQHGYITTISRAFNWGRRYKHVETNPIADMPRPTPLVRQEYVPPSLFPKLLYYAKERGERVHEVVLMMLDSGCRAEELFRLKAEHLHEQGDRLTLDIPQAKGRRRSRVIYLPPPSRKLVRRLVDEQTNARGYLFLNNWGQPWTSGALKSHFKSLSEIMGMRIVPTTLRHSFCYARLTQGYDPLVVAKWMGHVNTNMIAMRYGHLEGSEHLAELAQKSVLG